MDEHSQPPQPSVPVCGIGASAGGVEALQQFFSALPTDLGLAYVVIVHLAPDHKSELPSILRRWTTMPVIQVGDHNEEPLKPDQVYVIAPDRKLEITDTAVGASAFEQPRERRAAIDLFFRSLAHTHSDAFAVLLSGSGSDGAVGAKAVKERGGLILVQDPSEAAHSSMPRAAIATGIADLVLPVRELVGRLAALARAKQGVVIGAQVAGDAAAQVPAEEESALRDVLDVLRKRTGHDFSKYKRSTVLRRLSRRMQLAHRLTIAEYLEYLRASVPEAHALLNDLLISVTTFFRDPDAWAALQAQFIAPLVEQSDSDIQLRAWVPGCATGEEAYSLAMLFHEEFTHHDRPPNFIVFASDVDDAALAVAREGLYPQAISTDVPDARLHRYFRPDDDHYRVHAELRDHLVFAAHSILRDPPFSRLHLISCRNLLIYLDRDLQNQVMSILRYACRDEGTLFLGASESANEELFHAIDKKHRIFGMRPREDSTRPMLPDLSSTPLARSRYGIDTRPPARSTAAESHVVALEQVAPPSVVIDERWNVVHMSPTASRFFQQSGGALARRLTDLVRPEIRDELHALLQQAMETQAAQLSPFIAVRFNGAPHEVAVLAQQRAQAAEGRRDILVTFLDGGVATPEVPVADQEPSNQLVRTLREKLRQAEQRSEGIRDEHHLVTEDLRAANEELQSLNEEYRSTTEELETSKEELQSSNEELHTVNQELKLKLDEVSRGHSDLENLMAATNVATLFLTPDFRIKRFTPQLGDIFKVKSRDLDRPIADLKHTLDYDLEEDARRVLATVTPIEREVTSHSGQVYVVRLGPYRTAGKREMDGVVATFFDVTALKLAEAALRESRSRLSAELNVMRRLHAMTVSVATAPTMGEALDHVLAAAIDLHGADFGNVQLVDRASQQLQIVAHGGFPAEFLERFAEVDSSDNTACGRAFRLRQVVQIEDVANDPGYAPYRAVAEQVGYRSVQSVPLQARDGRILGVLSIHYREPHVFADRDRPLGDMLGRQAADLIESRAQHEDVQRLNEALRRRTDDLEASQEQLSRQAADLEQQDRHREEFLAALGHELRNPMAAILSSLALVTVTDDRSTRALAVLKRQTQHMTRLINDLLDVTRVRHGKLHLERRPTEINEAMVSAIEAVRSLAESKGLRLQGEPASEPLFVDADPERLGQILDNLLRNALVYTDRGEIVVHVRREGSTARVAIRDTGVGINPQDIRGLFEPYRRGGDGKRGEGLGLGLALAKALVEAHAGTITCQSEGPGRGSEFSFTIPLTTAAPATSASGPQKPSTRRRILVVDDQRDVAAMFATLLESLGQDVAVAYDASSAITLAREHRPEVAFLDVAMPGVSGGELARRLRQEFGADELRLIAVTGHDRSDARVQEGAFDHHLLKPVTVDSIVTLLNTADDNTPS